MDANFIKLKDIKVGQKIPAYKVKIEKKMYKKYNRLIGEINPMHLSRKYAQGLGFDDILIAGNFLFSYISKWIIDWIEKVDLLKCVNVKFENPVYPDDEIIFNGKIVRINNDYSSIECDYQVQKSNGNKVIRGEIELNFSKYI